jgi:hypothetical protein
MVVAQITQTPARLPGRFLDIPLDGGRVQSISVHTANRRHIIVANQFGGLWKTENGSTNWFLLDGLSTVFAIDVSYAPDGNTVIATLARDNRVDNGGGIWLSRDGGYTWSKPATANPPSSDRIPGRISAYGISYAPDNGNKVYVGTDHGVAVSDDNGSTWSHHMLETTSPISPDKEQNAARSVLALPDDKAIALCRTGIYSTDNGGETWNRIRSGDFTFGAPGGFKNIDVSPLDSDKVFILQDYSNLLLYEVAADSWTTLPLPGGRSRGPFVRVSRSSANASSIDIWVGAGVNLLKATCEDIDSVRSITASTWTALHRAAGLHDDSGYLGLDNDKRPVLYGSDGGLFKPTNAAATTWTLAATGGSGLNSYQITDLAGTNVGPLPSGGYKTSLYFSTQDNGIWASPDGGTTWPNSDCAEGFHIEVRKDAASDSEVIVAYGKVGCGPSGSMFSNANLLNQRAVPDVDTAGATLSNMWQAFFISPNNWVRYRVPPGANTEIWVSQNNGSNWRHIANVALQPWGVFAVSGSAANPTIYAPFRGARTRPDGSERVGLLKLTRVLRIPGAVRPGSLLVRNLVWNYGDRHLIYLPDDGSLGRRATEFDWQAVYGVDPTDPDYIIAPDIHNQVVKVSRDGGVSWHTDSNLTNEVTQGGSLLLYDADPYHMQVTHISFDPYNPDRILVGTREAGVIISEDRGNTWTTIPGSEVMLYVTGFFFKRDGTVMVSSYGMGLWKIDLRLHFIPFPDEYFCGARDPRACLIRWPPDPRILPRPVDWADKDVTVFLNGRINGLVLSGDEIKTISVTPGTTYKRYVGRTRDYRELHIVESAEGEGFGRLKGALAALENGEIIKGIILEENRMVGIISGEEEFTEEAGPDQPYLFITTSVPVAGTPVVGGDGVVHVAATGFIFEPEGDNYAVVSIDERVIDETAEVMKDGSAELKLKIPEQLSFGEHTVQVTQKVGSQEVTARSSFVKAAIDDFEQEVPG